MVDDEGRKKAAVIDLRRHGKVWEDFYDTLVASPVPRNPARAWRKSSAATHAVWLMPDFGVTFARSARKELNRFDVADRILLRIEKLTRHPRPRGAIKLQGKLKLWRIRVGEYRVIYSVDDTSHNVDIAQIRHRRDVYRDL